MSTIKAKLGTETICSHVVRLDYHYDPAKEVWRGKLVFVEERMGRQYGGNVVIEIESRRGDSCDGFLKSARERAVEEMRIFWT